MPTTPKQPSKVESLVFVIDDAQWADSATLDLLSYIGDRKSVV